jgi:hypothetical protein
MVKNVKQYFLIAAEGTHRTEERKKNYYPKEIFESRIRLFQHYIEEHTSIVFLYCKFSNPISGVTSKLYVTVKTYIFYLRNIFLQKT